VKTLLDNIEYPSDLRKLEIEQLPQLCDELRSFIIDEVSRNPGHFGASLGVVELSVALHYALNTPDDRIVWDVGHQAYPHKILTGRKNVFHTNRKLDGISGFPNPAESCYDAFGVGHSSTSISAALGMSIAAEISGNSTRQVVAVIGDGSLTGGMAFEALNHAGHQKSNILVVVNDNNMAIDANVGALNEYLTDITTSRAYNKLRDDVWQVLGKLNRFGPNARKLAQKIEGGVKSIVMREGNLFQALKFRYFGPIDGHDSVYLARLIEDLKQIPGPKLLHIRTQKGKGWPYAEENQTLWHAPGTFDKNTGKILVKVSSKPSPPKFQDVFGHTLVELAKADGKVVGITPAMASGCSMHLLMQELPGRAFDVGIAEQHAVTLAAGMAKDGLKPFCNIYSTFMQRAYDQVIHDVALQKLPVVFCLDRGGLVGADGATHHGAFDIAYMRAVPNMVVASPMDEAELRNMMLTANNYNEGPFTIRYPRGNGSLTNWRTEMQQMPVGRGRIIKEGTGIALLSLGPIGIEALQAINMLGDTENAALYDMRYAKPLDEELLHAIFAKHKQIITIEDGATTGGFGTAVLEFMADNQYFARVTRLGIPDKFIEHGTQEELRAMCGYDKAGILAAMQKTIALCVAI
jgi:1-deoxy-D-xylulose-5-phosphate synthase